jgi:hypothetical protein
MYEWEMAQGADIETARTAAVNTLVAGELVYLVNSRYFFASSLSLRAWIGNPYAVLAMAVLVAVQLVFTYTPFMQAAFQVRGLSGDVWLHIAWAALLIYLIVEIEKLVVRNLPKAARPTVAPAAPARRAPIRAGVALVYLLGSVAGVQGVLAIGRLYEALATGESVTVMGLALGGLAVLLAAVLLGDALGEVRSRGAGVAALKLPAPMMLLAVAWHAPAYPFQPEHLPWLIVAAMGLLVLAAAVLGLSLALRRQGRSER